MRDKFMWYLIENVDGKVADANEIEFQVVKSKL